MKHNCYTCIKSPDEFAPFQCAYVSKECYDAMQYRYSHDHHSRVYPNDKDCLAWSMSIPKTVRYISRIIIDIIAPIMITMIMLAGIVAIVCLIIVSKMAIGV